MPRLLSHPASTLLLALCSVLLARPVPACVEDPPILVLTSAGLKPALADWLRHRRDQGHRVRVEEIPAARIGEGAQPWIEVVRAVDPKVVLLAGDVSHVPAGRYRAVALGRECESDQVYGLPDPKTGVPRLQVGRIPAASAEQLQAALAKVLRHEKSFVPSEGRNSVLFLASPAYFGAAIDAMLEGIATASISGRLAPHFHVDVLYASPVSPFYLPPRDFPRYTRRAFERGPLLAIFNGHGHPRGFARVRDRRRFRFFDAGHVAGMKCVGQLPIFFGITCSTGDFEDPEKPGLCATLALEPEGPIAAFGSSEVSQPVPNLLLSQAVLERVANGSHSTLGAAIAAVRRDFDQRESDLAWFLESMVRGEDDVRVHKRHTQHLYNLFGDPSLRLGFPAKDVRMRVHVDGRELVIEGSCPSIESGTVLLRHEVERKIMKAALPAVPPRGKQRAGALRARHTAAVDKSLFREELPVREHEFCWRIPLARALPEVLAGRKQRQFWVRAYVWNASRDSVGALEIPQDLATR